MQRGYLFYIWAKINHTRTKLSDICTVADPGFPVGGRASVRGGMDFLCRCFSVKMYAKMKELGHIRGGVHPARPPLDPPMIYEGHCCVVCSGSLSNA